jgi:hypothetical protein
MDVLLSLSDDRNVDKKQLGHILDKVIVSHTRRVLQEEKTSGSNGIYIVLRQSVSSGMTNSSFTLLF